MQDALSLQPSMFVGEAHAAAGNPVYAYNFQQVRSDIHKGSAGVDHGGEMEFLFGTQPAGQEWDEADRTASRMMGDYWVNFARTGDPNGAGLPTWSTLTPGHTDYLVLDAMPSMTSTTPLEDEVRERVLAVVKRFWGR